ncbi:MAG: formylglycine-generating enzyme family protein, partial [Bacteroidota bacterium]
LALNLRAADRFQTVADMRNALKAPVHDHAEKPLATELEVAKEQFESLRKRKGSDGSFSFSDNQELERLLKKAKEEKGYEWQNLRSLIESELVTPRSNTGQIAIITIILIASVFLVYGYISSRKTSANVTSIQPVQTNGMNTDQVFQDSLPQAMDTSPSIRDNQEDLYRKTYLDSLRMDSILKQESATNYSNQETNTNPIIQRLLSNMVFVQGGRFTMGCTNEQGYDCEADEKPAHSVNISSFSIGKYEVTQEEWEAVMGSNPSNFSNCPKCPVENVSWNDIQNFIDALNRQTGRQFRLPTEAEWEYAARGGNRSGGHKFSGSDNIASVAWYDGNSGSRTHPVGQKAANALGLHDMTGNAWEWCNDWYGANYYSNSPGSNPRGPSSSDYRVLRGGSGLADPDFCRVSYRNYIHSRNRGNGSGFRLVSPSS